MLVALNCVGFDKSIHFLLVIRPHQITEEQQPARFCDTDNLSQHFARVGDVVDDAVGDYSVEHLIAIRHSLGVGMIELNSIAYAGNLDVEPRQIEHGYRRVGGDDAYFIGALTKENRYLRRTRADIEHK